MKQCTNTITVEVAFHFDNGIRPWRDISDLMPEYSVTITVPVEMPADDIDNFDLFKILAVEKLRPLNIEWSDCTDVTFMVDDIEEGDDIEAIFIPEKPEISGTIH